MLLSELQWYPSTTTDSQLADIPGARVVWQRDGKYRISAQLGYWRDLDPLAAQAILYHLLQPSSQHGEAK